MFGFYQKKVTKLNFFLKKTETGSNRFGSVFSVWLSFSGLTRLAWFFSGLGSIRFGFFDFLLIKSNRTGQFFQNFNWFDWFFFQFLFFRLFFFPVFSV
jgi:hypothetical protein